MALFKSLVLFLSLLALVVKGGVFHFTQCECEADSVTYTERAITNGLSLLGSQGIVLSPPDNAEVPCSNTSTGFDIGGISYTGTIPSGVQKDFPFFQFELELDPTDFNPNVPEPFSLLNIAGVIDVGLQAGIESDGYVNTEVIQLVLSGSGVTPDVTTLSSSFQTILNSRILISVTNNPTPFIFFCYEDQNTGSNCEAELNLFQQVTLGLGESDSLQFSIDSSASGEFSSRIKRVAIGDLDFSDVGGANLATTNAIFDSIETSIGADAKLIPFPKEADNERTIPATEEVETGLVTFNSFLNLIDNVNFLGTVATASADGTVTRNAENSQFTFEGNDDFFGETTFTFTYAVDPNDEAAGDFFGCLSLGNEVTVLVDVTNVDDPPVAVSRSEETFAGVASDINIAVATSVDFDNGLLDGGVFRFDSVPANGDVFVEDCANVNAQDTPVAVNQVIDVIDGNVTFCYVAGSNQLQDATDTISFTVANSEGDLSGDDVSTGTITLNGNSPIDIDDTLFTLFDEDAQGTVVANNLRQIVTGAEEVVFQVRFTSIPEEIQTFTVGGNNVVVGTAIDGAAIQTGPIVIRTNDNFFNAFDSVDNVDGKNLVNTENGVNVINNCAVNTITATADGLQITNVCPLVLGYEILIGGEVVETGVHNIIVEAVDDENPTLTRASGNANIVAVERGNSAFGSIEDIVFASDNGRSFFDIRVRIEGNAGATFGLSLGLQNTASGLGVDLGLADCSSNQLADVVCAATTITGPPAGITTLLRGYEFRVDLGEGAGSGSAVISIVDEADQVIDNQEIALDFDVVAAEPGFFDSNANVGAVAGGSALVVIGAVSFYIIKSTRARTEDGERVTKLETTNHANTFKARGKEQRNQKKKRSFEDEDSDDDEEKKAPKKKQVVSDDLLDWEKHIDEKTGEPFYHNAVTGETTWELPNKLSI